MIRSISKSNKVHTALFGIIALTLVVMIISYPDQAFQASLEGLTIWWNIVFPALLPFFILSEILLGLGVVHGLGVLMEPVMRLLFRLPGAGGWTVAASLTAGFPAGAKAACDLRRSGEINADEGERLLALSHWSSPIFITSVVAVGFWNRPDLGLPLAVIHLMSAFITGMIIGRIGFRNQKAADTSAPASPSKSIPKRSHRSAIQRAVSAMAEANRIDGRPLGRLLGDAVTSSVQSLLLIGGLMIVFSVLLEMLSISGFANSLESLMLNIFSPLGMPQELAGGIVTSLFEIHLGLHSISQSGDTAVWGAAMLSGGIAWGGLSLHAQIKSLTSGTDLRYAPFAAARLLQAAVSIAMTFLCWDFLTRWFSGGSPAFAEDPAGSVPSHQQGPDWPLLLPSVKMLAVFLLGMILISFLVTWFHRVFLAKRLLDDRRH